MIIINDVYYFGNKYEKANKMAIKYIMNEDRINIYGILKDTVHVV